MNKDVNKILEKGNCDSVRNGGEAQSEGQLAAMLWRQWSEAEWQTSSEAKVSGKSAQHDKAHRSGTMVDDEGVQMEFTFLSGPSSSFGLRRGLRGDCRLSSVACSA